MTTKLFQPIPQTYLTIRANSTYTFLDVVDVVDVSSFDQIVVELTVMNPPALATGNIVLHVKTANEELPYAGWDVYPPLDVSVGVTVAGTAYVTRKVCKREYDAVNNLYPLQRLFAFSVENTTNADKSLDVRVTVAGTGCGCGK